jgi:hypothetical protein
MRKTRTGTNFRIDEKHHLEIRLEPGEAEPKRPIPVIVKSGNGEPIPLEEPRILFRGRDRLALPLLRVYRQMCADDGATDYQLNSMDVMIKEFEDFAATSPTMKQPGSTRGK